MQSGETASAQVATSVYVYEIEGTLVNTCRGAAGGTRGKDFCDAV